jgi:hypothetical protein
MDMNKPPDETLKQGRNRSWLLAKFAHQILLQQLFIGNSFIFPLNYNMAQTNLFGCSIHGE